MSASPTLIVTVLHNSVPVLDDWLAGVRKLRDESRYPVLVSVVDNDSSDDSVRILQRSLAKDDPILVTAHDGNQGWGAGNNLALERARLVGAHDAVVFLNPDVILPAPTHDAMRAALDADPSAGAVIPCMTDGATGLRVPAFPRYSLADALLGLIGWRRFKASRWQKPRRLGKIHDIRGGYAEGCCVMVRSTTLELVGPFDENFFMYFDDTDLSLRIEGQGQGLLYLPDVAAFDLPGKGSRIRVGSPPDEPPGDDPLADDPLADERLDRYACYLSSELPYYAKWHGDRTARWLARYKLWFELPLRSLQWRLLYGTRGLAARCRPIAANYLRGARRPD